MQNTLDFGEMETMLCHDKYKEHSFTLFLFQDSLKANWNDSRLDASILPLRHLSFQSHVSSSHAFLETCCFSTFPTWIALTKLKSLKSHITLPALQVHQVNAPFLWVYFNLVLVPVPNWFEKAQNQWFVSNIKLSSLPSSMNRFLKG